MKEKTGDWMNSFTGKQFYPFVPDKNVVCIEDIAHALAHQCRFGGHPRQFLSVAQHCLMVARHLPPALQLRGLLHDASEAYLIDLPRPIKNFLPQYSELEAKWLGVIGEAFGLGDALVDMLPEVMKADNSALLTEKRDLMTESGLDWSDNGDVSVSGSPYPERVVPMMPAEAELAFKTEFARLMGRPLPADDATESPLMEAHRLVHGPRAASYGHPYYNFTSTGYIWTGCLYDILKPGAIVSPEHVAMCMVGVKLSREMNVPHRDNRVDAAGYIETLERVVQERARRVTTAGDNWPCVTCGTSAS